MATVEPQVIAVRISRPSGVGHLLSEPTMVNCPACEHFQLSVVQLEAVSCLQRFLGLTKMCKSWQGRSDINHYCGHCGCYIGRHIPIGCYERWLSRSARKQAAVDEMRLKSKPKDCAVRAQKARERVLAKRAEDRARQQAGQSQTLVVTTGTQ